MSNEHASLVIAATRLRLMLRSSGYATSKFSLQYLKLIITVLIWRIISVEVKSFSEFLLPFNELFFNLWLYIFS